ncbi:holin family protein [Planktotalea sp.]|uniref:holin family protein n=1 Tax=Planktotalea sp. TaxID=2029877 RepID=UPI0025DF287B|nr:holin family protein [Planktotalea sp.]
MGMMDRVFTMLFRSGGNIIRDTAEVFVENAEKSAARGAVSRGDALAQFAGEFQANQRGSFDCFMDGLNRIPCPAMALGTLGLFVAAMVDPIWFASRMPSIALVPQPLWWLLGAIVSFYFGARHQVKTQAFQKQIASSLALAPTVMRNLDALDAMRPKPVDPTTRTEPILSAPKPIKFPQNAALQDWAEQRG